MTTVILRQVTRQSLEHNSISGHYWTIDIPLQKWEVIGATGVVQTANTYKKARALQKEWQDFYNKYTIQCISITSP